MAGSSICIENFICLENRANQDSCRSEAEREIRTIAERALNAQAKMADCIPQYREQWRAAHI